MNVKRTSYFTFLVAITTLATVTNCSKVKGQTYNSCVADTHGQVCTEGLQLFDISLDDLERLDNGGTIDRLLKSRGLKTGKLKLAVDQSGDLSIYLVIDKDYKGPVSKLIFDHTCGSTPQYPPAFAHRAAGPYAAAPRYDKREGIAARNQILLE